MTHAFLRSHRDEIVRDWESLVSANPAEVKLADSVLRDHLPEFLEELADWLEHGEEPGTTKIRAAAFVHALDRLEHSYQLAQLVREFQFLRTAILRRLLAAEAAEPGLAGTGRTAERIAELARLNVGLDVAITDAVQHFVAERDRRLEDLRAEAHRREVIDRKRTEELLARSETVLAQAGTMAHLGAWWIDVSNHDDLNANPLHWSPEVYRIFGYEPGEVEVSNALFFQHVHPDDRERVRDATSQALAAKRPYVVEHRIVQRDGTERLVSDNGQARFDDQGRLALVVGAIQDVTEQRRSEQEVRESNQRKTEFLAVLSHELRNPLASIRNSIFLQGRAAAGSPQAARARGVIRRQTEHLVRLVDDLLDMTRISRGKIPIHKLRMDLRDVVRETCDDHQTVFDADDIEMRLDLPAGPVWVDADATRISQIVGNLLQNSAKFTPAEGHVVVTVSMREGQAEIAVRDTGVGLDPGDQERIFEPFAQSYQDLARTRGGLGLGLALVKGLVDLHGGSVRARSNRGDGSEFIVTLPLASPGAALAQASSPERPSGARKVLIVEDNGDVGQSLADLLELSGHRVRVARDGQTGLALARELKPDVILCDIGLPDIDGYEVARVLRADEALRATRLIALTGYALPEDRQRALDAGFDAHLPKPPSLEKLNDLLAPRGADAGEEAS